MKDFEVCFGGVFAALVAFAIASWAFNKVASYVSPTTGR